MAGIAWGAAVSSAAIAVEKSAYILTVEGMINPVTARYLARELDLATSAQAEVVVIRLNTPGGLDLSMREMSQAILNAKIPVIVYVSPRGARAASAGMFLTLAAHIAAMAPGTNIGAAHPVVLAPDREGNKPSAAMDEKMVQDAAAFARAIATIRGRDPSWAEKAVKHSVSITAPEALKARVIDLLAEDIDELLSRVDGMEVLVGSRKASVSTRGVAKVERPMRLFERIFQYLGDPNVVYLLMTIGLIGIIAELYHPGTYFAGVTGVISLILAFAAFGSLPINWAAVLLIGFGVLLLLAEVHTPGIGVLGFVGIVTFFIGSLMLYNAPASPSGPVVHLSPWLVGGMTAFVGSFFLIVLRAALKARHLPIATGTQALQGALGVVISDLDPGGSIRVESEVWTAVAQSSESELPIREGEWVEVVDVEGVTLKVTRKADAPGLRTAREPVNNRKTRGTYGD